MDVLKEKPSYNENDGNNESNSSDLLLRTRFAQIETRAEV